MSSSNLTLENTCDGISHYKNMLIVQSILILTGNIIEDDPLYKLLLNDTGDIPISPLEKDFQWKELYNPVGTVIISLQPLCTGITSSGQNLHGLDRWSYITITGRQNNIIIIISAYRVCDPFIMNTCSISNIMQQWQILEKIHLEYENIINK